jgi:hypothetical protein
MTRPFALPLLGVTLLSLALLGACQDGPTEADGMARVQILLTDAPSDYLETAEVWISRVVLVPGEDDSVEGSGFVDLYNDPAAPQWFDLLTLRDGITAELSEVVEVPEGRYAQLRLVVDSARVTLRDGYTFRDGSVTRPLFVPSGSQSGIKVQLADPLEAEEGGVTILTVDFDVDRNFVMQGNPDTPAGIQGILFTPVLQEKGRTAEP